MTTAAGAVLLQAVAERIIVQLLRKSGHTDARPVASRPAGGAGVDLVYTSSGQRTRIKVKPDAYFGVDPAKVGDRALTFYRPDAGHYAFESISNNVTREPGWIFNSEADYLYYYYIALSQSESEVAALLSEPDAVFFGELKVERDQLHVILMKNIRRWFEQHYEEYTPRPVTIGDHSAWYRLIPRPDIEKEVQGINIVASVFAGLGD